MKDRAQYLVFFLLFCGLFSIPRVTPNLEAYSTNNRANSINIIAIMVEFEYEEIDDPRTTGRGHFLKQSGESLDSLINFYGYNQPRCDGFLLDSPPHNASYFEDQIAATKNYYLNISNNNIESFNYQVIDSVYQLDKKIAEYSEMSSYSEPEEAIALLYSEAIELASIDIEGILELENLDTDDVFIVVFHAGMGEDYTFEGYLDPANYDIRSAYIEDSMLSLVPNESWMKQNNITSGLLLPEGLNLIYYNTIDDIYGYNPSGLCEVQIGMTGLFTYLLGYEFGLPEMFNRITGKTAIGSFGLMDVGSFNVYGVIPSPPQAWSRVQLGWDYSETLIPNNAETETIPLRYDNQSEQSIYRVNISESEYYLMENVNNTLFDEFGIKEILYSDSLNNISIPSSLHSIFDRLLYIDDYEDILSYDTECNPNSKLTISSETGVILCVDSYDYGLPSRGLMIWHINESYSDNLNDDINQRTVKLIEADGAQDIGYQNYMYPIANPTIGWEWDLWYPDNEAYFFINDNQDKVNFNSNTTPSSHTDSGARSYIQINNIRYSSDNLSIKVTLAPEVDSFISSSIVDSISFSVLGGGVSNDDGYIIINNIDTQEFQTITSTAAVTENLNINYDSSYFAVLDTNLTIHTCLSTNYYDFEENECISLESYIPRGYFYNSQVFDNLPLQFREINFYSLGIGDIDQDGLDEILEVSDDFLYCYNSNGISCNGFPLSGNFSGNVLISNIIGDIYPEILIRNGEEIQIISSSGQILLRIPSEYSELLLLVPNWGNYYALIDGYRKLLFNRLDNLVNDYWLSPNGMSNNQPDVNPNSLHTSNNSSENSNISVFYNYPNPVVDGLTTFRYFLLIADKIDIKIYSSSGFLIETIIDDDIHENEYNEINWNVLDLNSGVYIANLIAYSNNKEIASSVTKVLVVNK